MLFTHLLMVARPFSPVDLFIDLVVPTTCKSSICLTICIWVPNSRRIERGWVPWSDLEDYEDSDAHGIQQG